MKFRNLIFFLPNFDQGGAANSIKRLCLNFNKKNYKIFIVCLGKCFYKDEFTKHKINVLELKASKTIFCFNEIKKRLLKHHKLSKQNTIFISNINYANVLSVIFIKLLFSYKLILVERTSLNELDVYFNNKDYFKKKIIKFLIAVFYKYADKVIANSRKTSNELKALSKSSITYIYPGTIKKIRPFKKKKRKKLYHILSYGRLSKEKNLILLLRAFGQLGKIDYKLNILGNGEQRNFLDKEIKIRKLQNKVKIVKYQNNSHKYFIKSDLFINSSHFEGFPNSVVEAINFNIPVISSKSGGGINEILLNGKGGYLFENNVLNDLIKKIKLFFHDSNIFFEKAYFAKKGLKRFLLKNSVRNYEKIIEKI